MTLKTITTNYPSLHQPGGFRALSANAGHNVTYGVYQIGFESSRVPTTFSVYMPTGLVQATIYLFKAEGALVAGAMRWGDIPQPVSLSLNTWQSFAFDNGEVGGLLDGKTYVPRPLGGHQTIIDRYFRTPLTSGGWLNVKVYNVKGSVFKLSYAIQVSQDIWPSWLAGVSWDANGNPTSAGTIPSPVPYINQTCTLKPNTTQLTIDTGGRILKSTEVKPDKTIVLKF